MDKKTLKNQEGFTLIEVLIVVMIVGLLSVMAINGYSDYRRTALLHLAGESIVSQFYEARDRTIHGDIGREGFEKVKAEIERGEAADVDVKCYGMAIVDNQFKSFEVDFNKKKFWDGQQWVNTGCLAPKEFKDLELDERIEVLEVNSRKGLARADIVLTFMPPSGDLVVRGADQDDMLNVVIRYGASDNDRYKKNVNFNLKTAKANVTQFKK